MGPGQQTEAELRLFDEYNDHLKQRADCGTDILSSHLLRLHPFVHLLLARIISFCAIQLDPAVSSMAPDQETETAPRLFDEFNDDDDDAHFYGGVGGKNDGLRVILVAPDRSPAVPLLEKNDLCCGKKKSAAAEDRNDSAAAATAAGGDDNRAGKIPGPPVLDTGWAGSGVAMYWKTRGDFKEGKRGEAAQPAAAFDEGEAGAREGEKGGGTEVGKVIRISTSLGEGGILVLCISVVLRTMDEEDGVIISCMTETYETIDPRIPIMSVRKRGRGNTPRGYGSFLSAGRGPAAFRDIGQIWGIFAISVWGTRPCPLRAQRQE